MVDEASHLRVRRLVRVADRGAVAMSGAVERFELARQAQEVGLVVTCLRRHRNLPGGALYEVELWCEDGELWARATYAAPEDIREMVGQYAERESRRRGNVDVPVVTVRCARPECEVTASVRPGDLRAVEGWTFTSETSWLCPQESPAFWRDGVRVGP